MLEYLPTNWSLKGLVVGQVAFGEKWFGELAPNEQKPAKECGRNKKAAFYKYANLLPSGFSSLSRVEMIDQIFWKRPFFAFSLDAFHPSWASDSRNKKTQILSK